MFRAFGWSQDPDLYSDEWSMLWNEEIMAKYPFGPNNRRFGQVLYGVNLSARPERKVTKIL